MNAQEMQPFCSTEETRYHICKPVSRGEFTYATNDHILVRVPRLADVAEDSEAPNFEKVIKVATGMDDLVALAVALPAPKTEECTDCEGDNQSLHDCPDCECMCETCGGSGTYEPNVSCAINGALFDVKYIRQIAALPAARFPRQPSKSGPSWFEFEGGIGCVMALRSTYSRDIGELTNNQEQPHAHS